MVYHQHLSVWLDGSLDKPDANHLLGPLHTPHQFQIELLNDEHEFSLQIHPHETFRNQNSGASVIV